MDFEAASESLDGDRHIASVAGEVDLTSGPELERALFAMPEDGVASVVVDLTDCSVMDCTGLQLLSRAQRRLERSGGRLRVCLGEPERAQVLRDYAARPGLRGLFVAGHRLER